VFSSSGLDYVPHPPQITIIPDTIKSKYDEVYFEGVELETTQFYERVRNDKYFEPSIEIISKESVAKFIETAINNKYERFLFLVNSNDIVDYMPVVTEALKKYPDIDSKVVKIDALSFPLAHLALECDKIFRATDSLDNVMSYINNFKNSFKILFYSPKENILPSVKRIDFDEDVISAAIQGKLFVYDGESIQEIRKNLQESYLEKMFDLFTEHTIGSKVVPFIVYTNRHSLYNDVLERKLISIYPRLKSLKKYPIPAILGNKMGPNTIGIGFIKKVDE